MDGRFSPVGTVLSAVECNLHPVSKAQLLEAEGPVKFYGLIPAVALSSRIPSKVALTGDRRVCQWYCCDCGKSYGTLRTAKLEPAVRPTDKVVVEPATRFTCLRCRHMMCPYCLKVRYLDLE